MVRQTPAKGTAPADVATAAKPQVPAIALAARLPVATVAEDGSRRQAFSLFLFGALAFGLLLVGFASTPPHLVRFSPLSAFLYNRRLDLGLTGTGILVTIPLLYLILNAGS